MKAMFLAVAMVFVMGASVYAAPQEQNDSTSVAAPAAVQEPKPIQPSELPDAVKNAFLSQFPNVKVHGLTFDGKAYKFDYTAADGTDASVSYDANGQKL